MQRLIVLAVAIGMVVLLASGIALAQEESLPMVSGSLWVE